MNLRRVSIIALAAAGLIATPLSAAPPPVVATDAASDAANQSVVEALYRAFAANDGATIGGLLAPDLVWMEAESGPYADRNPYNGPGAVFEGVFARIGAGYEGFVVTPAVFIASGDRVVALGRYPEPTGRPARRWTPSSPMSSLSRAARSRDSSSTPTPLNGSMWSRRTDRQSRGQTVTSSGQTSRFGEPW